MPKGFEDVTWYGMGPHENYIDKCESAIMDVYKSTVDDEYVDYINPQEFGNKMNTYWACVENNRGLGLMMTNDVGFETSVRHYSDEDITNSTHSHLLTKLDETIFNIDYKQMGLGSHSCGPLPMPQYILKNEPMSFTFSLRALVNRTKSKIR